MKCCGSPWPEVILYISGMFFVIFGGGSLIVSINPRPLESSTWESFLYVGICFIVIGGILLVLTVLIPEIPSQTSCFGSDERDAFSSVVDLLEDVQSVGCRDSPIVKLREATLRSEEYVKVIKGCMMLQPPLSGSEGILFYKETVV